MHSELGPGERELELQLGQLMPAEHRIQRDTLMFRAGQATAEQRARAWRTGTIALLLLSAALSARMLLPGPTRPAPSLAVTETPPERPATPGIERITEPATLAAAIGFPEAMAGYPRLRNRVMLEGVEALPEPNWVLRKEEAIDPATEGLRPPTLGPSPSAGSLWRLHETMNGDRS